MQHASIRLAAGLAPLLGLGCGAEPAPAPPLVGAAPFIAPAGVGLLGDWLLVADTGFDAAVPGRYRPGRVHVVRRVDLELIASLPAGDNPQWITVAGDRAYVVASGAIAFDGEGRAYAASAGTLFALERAAPTAWAWSLPLPLGDDPRLGAYGRLALAEGGSLGVLGSGTAGAVFTVALDAPAVLRGADDPLQLFPTPAGGNGQTVAIGLGTRLAVLGFNHDQLCLFTPSGSQLGAARCAGLDREPDLLEGPLDALGLPDGRLAVAMSLANAIYLVDAGAAPWRIEAVVPAGLALNRLALRGDELLALNSLGNHLQRVALADPLAAQPRLVFPVGSNPFDLVLAPPGAVGYVSLFGAGAVAAIDLQSNAIVGWVADARSDAPPVDTCTDYGMGGVYASEVRDLQLGPGGGFGQEALPSVVLGPPQGGGMHAGSLDVVSLGAGGSIVLGVAPARIVDGPGVDFVIFENAFVVGALAWAEPARVAVAAEDALSDARWLEFPCDLAASAAEPPASWPYPGCAGVQPVIASAASCVQPWDWPASGGDGYDLALLGLSEVRLVRLTDGSSQGAGSTAGFDLDALVLLNWAW